LDMPLAMLFIILVVGGINKKRQAGEACPKKKKWNLKLSIFKAEGHG